MCVIFMTEDRAKWRAVSEEAPALRKSFGSEGIGTYGRTYNLPVALATGSFLDNVEQLPS